MSSRTKKIFANLPPTTTKNSYSTVKKQTEKKDFRICKESLLEENIYKVPLCYEDFPEINMSMETKTSCRFVQDLDLSMFKENMNKKEDQIELFCDEVIPESPNENINEKENKIELFCDERILEPENNADLVNNISFLNPIAETTEQSIDEKENEQRDFDSDDSVKDPLYVPPSKSHFDSNDSSDIDNNDINIESSHNCNILSKSTINEKEKENRNNEEEENSNNEKEKSGYNEGISNFAEASGSRLEDEGKNDNGNDGDNENENNNKNLLTKTGEPRKRKKYEICLSERKQLKKQKIKQEHNVKPGCGSKCRKKCMENFSEDTRVVINRNYWDLKFSEQRIYVRNLCARQEPQRRKKLEGAIENRKSDSFRYFLRHPCNDTKENIYKTFFLTTLGYNKSNDKFLYNILTSDKVEDGRGKHTKIIPLDKSIIINHIKLYNPTISHYRREHAPMRLYLPSDINIKLMHNDFCQQHPELSVSYDTYRIQVKKMNISFTKLGNEECELCEEYSLHNPDHKIQKQGDCEKCCEWEAHLTKAKLARDLYLSHKEKSNDPQHLYVSVDLQKVIMLPRMEGFKSVLFCPRIIAFNESFVPVGKSTRKPFAVVWHEALSGRKQDDIISTFHAFFKANRNIEEIDIWLDNCASQNKNWLLFSYLVYLINSNIVGIKKVTLNYLQAGHTFMSADHLHHQVELSMSKRNKICDFPDFIETMRAANSGKIDVKEMNYTDFYIVKNYISQRKIQNARPRPYLNEIVKVTFTRGQFYALYKTDFSSDDKELNFLTEVFIKNKGNIEMLNPLTSPRGISSRRKQNIINKLGPLMLPHNLQFWEALPENSDTENNE